MYLRISLLRFKKNFALVGVSNYSQVRRLFGSRQSEYAANFFGYIRLRPPRQADVLRGAHVQNKKYRLLFFFAEGFHVGAVPFSRHIPVDGTNVIAVLIGTPPLKLQPRSFENRMKVALHLAIDSLANLNLILAQFFQNLFHFMVVLAGKVNN